MLDAGSSARRPGQPAAPMRIPLACPNVQRLSSDHSETSANFLAWTNSGPAEWSTPFVTVALMLTFSEVA
jgi:hypothetical protein